MSKFNIPIKYIKKIDIINIKGGITGNQVYKKYRPDYFINLALYDSNTGINITHLKDEKIESGYLFSNEGIGIKGENELVFCSKDDKTVRDFVAGSPILVKNGVKNIDWGNKYSEYVDKSHIRSAIGFNANSITLLTTDKKMDLNGLSETLISENCQFAINLDGGGSCHLQKGEQVIKKSTRKNASWLLIYLKEGEKMNKPKKVFLSIGHGGKDSGAVANGLKEKDINLNIGIACMDELKSYGVEVAMSRYKDEDDSINEAIRECNEYDPNIAVDIHTNSGGGDGFEVYHHSGGGNSKKLATCIEAEAKKLNNSRGLKTKLSERTGKDYYGFIRDTNPPAVIVECAFIDNKEDISVVDELEEQKAFGIAYAKGILKYFGIEYKEEEYPDVSDWARTAWKWAVDNKIVDGSNPKGVVTREMLVQVLFNLNKKGEN